MNPLDPERLGGDLILQDFRADVEPAWRATIKACRVIGRRLGPGYVVEGYGDDDSEQQTAANVEGAFLVGRAENAPQGYNGQWRLGAAAAVLAEASKRPRPQAGGATITRADADQGPRDAKLRLVRDEAWTEDDRLDRELTASLHPDTPDLAAGTPVVILRGTSEDAQELLALPVGGYTLRAINRGPDPDMSSVLYDQDAQGRDDPRWRAPLHRVWRVARLGPRCSAGDSEPAEAIAWQLAGPSRGLVVDAPSAPLRPPAPEGTRAAEEAASGQRPVTQLGGVYTLDQLRRQQEERLQALGQGQGGTVLGGVTILGGTRERGPGGATQASGGQQTTVADLDRPTTALQAPNVYAALSAKAGGPIDVGDAGDVHRIGLTEDGCPINAGHLSTGALWRGGPGDGPFDFEGGVAALASGYSERSYVHLQWDPSKTHTGPCGNTLRGAWAWTAEVPYFVPEDRDPPPPPPVGGLLIPGWPGPGGGPGAGPGPGPGPGPAPGGGGGESWGPGPWPYGPYGPGGPPPGGYLPGGKPAPQECHTTPDGGGQNAAPGGPSGPVGQWPTEQITAGFGALSGMLSGLLAPGAALGGGASPAAPAPAAGGEAGGARGAQKRGDRWAPLAKAYGLALGCIEPGGGVRLPQHDLDRLRSELRVDSQGRLIGAAPRIGDAPGWRSAIMGGALQRVPTTVSSLAIGGSLQLRATPWAQGELDVGVGGFRDDASQAEQGKLPVTLGLTGWATGDGTATGAGAALRYGATPTAAGPRAVLSRAELANGEGLSSIMAGDYGPGGRLAGSVEPLTLDVPPGVSRLWFGSLDGSGGQGTGVMLSSGASGALALQSYSAGVADAEKVTITPGVGVDISGDAVTVNGAPIGGAGVSDFGGSGANGATTTASNTQFSSPLNATSWTLNTGINAYAPAGKPLVTLATGNMTINGVIEMGGRGIVYEETGGAGGQGGTSTSAGQDAPEAHSSGGPEFGRTLLAVTLGGQGGGGGGSGDFEDGDNGGNGAGGKTTAYRNAAVMGDAGDAQSAGAGGTASVGSWGENAGQNGDNASTLKLGSTWEDFFAALGGSIAGLLGGGAQGGGGGGGGNCGIDDGNGFTFGSPGTVPLATLASGATPGSGTDAPATGAGMGGIGGASGPGGGVWRGEAAGSLTFGGSSAVNLGGSDGGDGGDGGDCDEGGGVACVGAGAGGGAGGSGAGLGIVRHAGAKSGSPTTDVAGGVGGLGGTGATTTGTSMGDGGDAGDGGNGEDGYLIFLRVA